VRIGRSLAGALFVVAAIPCWGCGLAPHDFRKIQHPAPLVRARSVGLGGSQPDTQVVPALVGRLADEDPVVRLAANEELRKRTGRDFGFVPWASPEERTAAIARWRSWLTGPPMPAGSIQSPELPPLPVKSPPAPRSRRLRRIQPQAATTEDPPS
jgi:hypothetical protein